MKKIFALVALLGVLLAVSLPADKPTRTMVGAASGALKADLDAILARGNHILNIIDWGAGTGLAAAVNTAAINAAIADMQTGDWLLIPAGTFMVTNGIEFDPPSTCGMICYGILSGNQTANVPILTIGDATGGAVRSGYHIQNLKLMSNAALAPVFPWTKNSIGVRVINCQLSNIGIDNIQNFWYGLQVTGTDGLTNAANNFWIDKITDCYRNIHIAANQGGALGGAGIVDESRFFNGRMIATTLADKVAFTVQMTDPLQNCTMTIAGNVLTTTPTGGATAFNLDLTLAANDTIGEVIALIAADGDYDCTINANAETSWPSTLLTAIAAEDISTAPYDTAISGYAGNVAVYMAHDAVDSPSGHFFDNFYLDAGTNGTSLYIGGDTNYFRHVVFGSLAGPCTFTSDSQSNACEIPELPAAGFITDGGTTNRFPWWGTVRRAVSTATLGTVAATGNAYVFTTNRPVYIERIDLVSSTGIATSDVNFWAVQVYNVTGAVDLASTAPTTMTTGGTAVTADTIWSVTPDQNQTLAAGDVLQIQFTKTLNPDPWSSTFVVVHYRVAE